MKKILFIIPSLGMGGLEKVQVTLANKLSELGYDVTVLTFDRGEDLKSTLSKKIKFIHKPPKPFRIMRKIPYIRYKFYDDGLWETRASAKKLYKYYVGNERFDIEIAFFRGRAVKIISGSTNNAAKHIAWVHNDFRKATGWNANFTSKEEVKSAYSFFDKVVCVSNQAKDGFVETIGKLDNLTVIYNLLPIEEIVSLSNSETKELPPAKMKIVVVARLLDSAKGQKRLINAVSSLRKIGADISLTIVGSGDDYNSMVSLVKSNNAESYITFAGQQLNPYPYIKSADLLVCSSYFEGYNLTVAEALILGVPVISTDCAGPNEILNYGEYGMIVENSEKGLYNGLLRLYENPDLLNDYKNKATQRRDFFDGDRILNQVINLF